MGRFGNQAAHFLGALNFAKRLNRTLALPPWRSGTFLTRSGFNWSPSSRITKVFQWKTFCRSLQPQKWPPGRRTGYCYSPTNPESHDCEMKNGNPLGYDVDDPSTLKIWQERYPPDKHPVLAFKGAPATFPVLRHHRHLQRYVLWSDKMNRIVEDYITKEMKAAPFIGVHMRIGVDWLFFFLPDPRLTVPSSIQHNVKDTEVEDKITEDSRCIEEEVMELSRKKETVLAGVHSTAADKPKAVGVCAALQIPGVIEYSLALFFTKLVSYTFLFWLPLYISKANGGYIGTRKVSSQLSDWLSVYFDLGGIVGTTLLGGVSDRLGAQAVVVALLLYLSVPILYIYRLFGSTHISVTVVLLVASGMCVNGPLGVITTSVSTDLGTHKSLRRNENAKATVAAIIDGTGSLGAAVGPLIAGAVSEYSWNYSFYFLMSSCLLSGLLLTRLVISDLSQWRCGLSQRNGSKGQFVSYHEVCTLCRAGRPNLVELQHLGSTVEWSSDEL
eukprot:Em0006g883a